MQPSSRALKPIRNLYHDANMRSSYCLRIAGILRRKLTACWPTIPNACSLTVCAPHSSYALMRSLRDHHLLRPPSKRRARTCTIPRAVTQPLRRAWLKGGAALAVEHYGAIVINWPRDILALVVAHALDFRLGRRRMLRDHVAQVLPEWKAATPGYASVLAMYAFGLEENGQYRRAEKLARRALAIDPQHPGAVHVIAHVMEMQGRFREGLAFLAVTEPAWAEGTGFSVHLAWHRALFHLDANDPGSAIAVYDAQIANERAPGMSVLADASALLWRLQLRNIEVGGRWPLLADRWEMQTLAGARPFYVVHAMMAFNAAGRTSAVAHVFEALPHTDTSGASLSLPEDALAPLFCEALLAFARSNYAGCVEWLTRVRHIAHRCGGSLAQCDLIHLTFTEAALRTRNARLARALVADRAAQKPASRFNRLLQRRLRMILPAIA